MRGLFITGTNTGVGKTYVGGLIAHALVETGHRVGVYKPVESGCRRQGRQLVAGDAELLWNAAGRPGTLEAVCPQRFEAPLAPPQAARAEGKDVDRQLIRSGFSVWRSSYEIVLVEGAGGLLSPVSDEDLNADVAADLGLPLLIVASNELGTINATLQTVVSAKSVVPQLEIKGVVLSQNAPRRDDPSLATNAAEITARCDAPLLASIRFGEAAPQPDVDWAALING